MRCLCPLSISLYFWMFLLADQLSLVTALIIMGTEGFSCIVMSWGSLYYLYLVRPLGFVLSLQCKIRVNYMAGREGSANLTCEEMLGEICLLNLFSLTVGFCPLVILWATWVGAYWLFWLCSISQGSSAHDRTEPSLQ